MIVFGRPIHRRYTKAVAVIFSVIAIIILTLIILI